MVGVRKRGEAIREFILENVPEHRNDIGTLAAKKFGVTRQAINHHIRRLVDKGSLSVSGPRSRPIYELRPDVEHVYRCTIDETLEEDVLWRTAVVPHLDHLPDNAIGIWEYGFTEMVNNAIDHSDGQTLDIHIQRFKPHVEIYVCDDGVGIFKKIKDALKLDDERHAVLELAKGKFTTDPERHTGEGIFFSSRMFDEFSILSGGVYYAHDFDDADEWIVQAQKTITGTTVHMRLKNDCERTTNEVFDEYAGTDEYEFTRTVVPVTLARYGDDNLISRSQAKRMLTRIDRFTKVLFDFKSVDSVGQSFADEVFRVFANRHPEIEISVINASKKVRRMISRAQAVR